MKAALRYSVAQLALNVLEVSITLLHWKNCTPYADAYFPHYIDGLVQERNSSTLAMGLRLSCIYPSICSSELTLVHFVKVTLDPLHSKSDNFTIHTIPGHNFGQLLIWNSPSGTWWNRLPYPQVLISIMHNNFLVTYITQKWWGLQISKFTQINRNMFIRGTKSAFCSGISTCFVVHWSCITIYKDSWCSCCTSIPVSCRVIVHLCYTTKSHFST